MELTNVIKAPVLTEKTYQQMSNGVYTFKVDYHANKYQIAQVVQLIFKVKVEKVNTIKVEKKPKSVGRFHGFTNRYKKAIITLAPGYEINLFPNEEAKEKEEKNKSEANKEAKKTLASDIEKRVAAKLANKKQQTPSTQKVVKNKTTHRKVGGE
ncbi:50S ribosomal protein L23 [Mycoplasmopsis cricetuli]|uniref:50S ribosomal protein L23 n=1 Tax=Mycoplasmopsis cricetuli TaxID=171283 RepID=UPI00046F0CB7|nr:50S ribosomal protein L23 [Mycoplasmopsis cricetuli]